MASRTVTVKPSGGDYTTLALAVSGEITANADLTSDNGSGAAGPLIIEIQGTWSSDDTSAVSIDGFTTSSANYLEIRADSDNKAIKTSWDTGRYRLVVAGTAITNTDAYVRIKGLQVKATGTYVMYLAAWNSSTPNDIRVQNCRIRGDGTTNNVKGIYSYDSGTSPVVTIENTIVEACSEGIRQSDGTLTINHCVVYGRNSSDYGIWAQSDIQTLVVQNTAVFNCATDDYLEDGGTPSSVTYDHVASDDGDGTNSVSPDSSDWTNEFEDPANGDFTLLNSGNLFEGGTTITGGPSADIEGDSWGSPPSIGADEYAADSSAVPQIMLAHNQFTGGL